MEQNHTDFWRRLQSSVDVAVASQLPDKLEGVRDGFERYFRNGTSLPLPVKLPVVVVPTNKDERSGGLLMRDDAILSLACRRARALEDAAGVPRSFYVGTEAGFVSAAAEGERRVMVRTWAVVRGAGGEGWGSSGSLQLPAEVIPDRESGITPLMTSTRRHGGIVASVTAGSETRRTATALATFHALAALFHDSLTQV